MLRAFARYADWLHMRWPAGRVEPLPVIRADGSTNVPGLFVAGDLTGIPLLKSSLDSGARVARTIAAEPGRARSSGEPTLELAIVGAGCAGMAAAIEAKRLGLSFVVIEAAEPFFTIANFPRRKPIFTYPRAMTPIGQLQVHAVRKEELLDELRAQAAAQGIVTRPGHAERIDRTSAGLEVVLADGTRVAARRVLVAIGRSGDFRRLGVPGEDRDKVSNRLHDPHDFAGRRVLVVGGGDSALEAAVALADAGAEVTLAHRGPAFTRPKPENLARLEACARRGRLAVRLVTRVVAIGERDATLATDGGVEGPIANDAVFAMIGREAPIAFFRRSGVAIAGEMTPGRWAAFAAFVAFCAWLYDWKSGGFFTALWTRNGWFPTNLPGLLASAGGRVAAAASDRRTLLGTLAISAAGPAFWYTLAYSIVIVVFGIRRIRRRRTPYVLAQTFVLMGIQVLPLFLVPELILPLLDAHGALPRPIADALFPVVSYGHGREFWRAYGFVLAWPLNVYNVFTHEPLWAWIAIGFVQTCVLIPLGVYLYGKGFYCGWICSCGALAETLGDTHRHKMPHGPGWNRLNLFGQGILAVAIALLLVRIAGWALPDGNWADRLFDPVLGAGYKWTVDVFLAGVVGYGVYFWYSGRFWCRFMCPLAAWMHVVARFSRFAIAADKPRCISCNRCTSVCHMGIDVMGFANKGLPMQDPECVRCSACVQVCPTGVLEFGTVRRDGTLISVDSLMASPVRARERD